MLSRRDAAIVGAYTGYLCGPFQDMHEYIEQLMERPVWSHELADSATMDEIRKRAKADFISICFKEDNEVSNTVPQAQAIVGGA